MEDAGGRTAKASADKVNPEEASANSRRMGQSTLGKPKGARNRCKGQGSTNPKSKALPRIDPKDQTKDAAAETRKNESEQSKRASIANESPKEVSAKSKKDSPITSEDSKRAAAKSKQLGKRENSPSESRKSAEPRVTRNMRHAEVGVTQSLTRARDESNENEEPNPTCCCT